MKFYVIYDVDYEGSTVLEFDQLDEAIKEYDSCKESAYRENARIIQGTELKLRTQTVVEK